MRYLQCCQNFVLNITCSGKLETTIALSYNSKFKEDVSFKRTDQRIYSSFVPRRFPSYDQHPKSSFWIIELIQNNVGEISLSNFLVL